MVGQVSLSEIMLGAILASAITALFVWSKSVSMVRLRLKWKMLAPARQLPQAIVWETLLIFWALVRKMRGKRVFGTMLKVPLEHTGHDPTSAAWRAVMVFGVTISPNSYVCDVDLEKGEIQMRQLVGRKLSSSDRAFVEQPL